MIEAKVDLEATFVTYAEVKRANGDKQYFKVVGGNQTEDEDGNITVTDGQHIWITEEEYKEGTK